MNGYKNLEIAYQNALREIDWEAGELVADRLAMSMFLQYLDTIADGPAKEWKIADLVARELERD